MMTIAVAGCINRDTVIHQGRPVIRGFGGILYNVFGLARLLGDDARIIPICNLGRDAAVPVQRFLSTERNVCTTHIRVIDSVNNHCRMTYPIVGERLERFTGFVPAISFEQLKPAMSSDLTLVNFISGRDLTLRTLQRFRSEYAATVYLDFHTLALGLRHNGTRFLRRPKRWRDYVTTCDYLQMNGNEFSLLAGEEPDDRALRRFFSNHVRTTCEAMIVTLGPRGVAMVSKRSHGSVISRLSPRSRPRSSEPTGAGDLVAAGFCAGIVAGKPLDQCLRLAVDCGTRACSALHPQDIQLPKLLT
jgi:sugar/nucleoside kinase (ribokinase family)